MMGRVTGKKSVKIGWFPIGSVPPHFFALPVMGRAVAADPHPHPRRASRRRAEHP